MPTYEYQCVKCEHRFEEFHGISEQPKLKCPKCRGRVRRLISGGAGLLFKGSGFYITDYRSESYRKAAQSESSSSSAASKSDSSSAKSASKPPTSTP
ncbi:MAG: zinc ribbon domain-containing protein [Kiritimatiellae bacterium]|nr:zinc ribbon domain-containing protein [Kiritimatiellia bacterium]